MKAMLEVVHNHFRAAALLLAIAALTWQPAVAPPKATEDKQPDLADLANLGEKFLETGKLQVKAAGFLEIELNVKKSDFTWAHAWDVFVGTLERTSYFCAIKHETTIPVLKRMVCEMALTSSTGVAPDIAGVIQKAGQEFLKCMKVEVPRVLVMYAKDLFVIKVQKGKQLVAVEEGQSIIPKQLYDYFKDKAEGLLNDKKEQIVTSLEALPFLKKVPWLAPIIRYVMTVDTEINAAAEGVDTKAQQKILEIEAALAEQDMKTDSDKKKTYTSLINDMFETSKDYVIKEAQDHVGDVVEMVTTGKAINTKNIMQLVWNGWEGIKDKACDLMWAVAIDAAWEQLKDGREGLKYITDTAMFALPESFLGKKDSYFNKYKSEREAALKQEEEDRKESVHPYTIYVRQMVKKQLAKKKADPEAQKEKEFKDPQHYELDEAAAKKHMEEMIKQTVIPTTVNLWWMYDYRMQIIEKKEGTELTEAEKALQAKNDKDMLRALQVGVDHCATIYNPFHIRTLFCYDNAIMGDVEERNLARTAIHKDKFKVYWAQVLSKKSKAEVKEIYQDYAGKMPPGLEHCKIEENVYDPVRKVNTNWVEVGKQTAECMDPTHLLLGDDGKIDREKHAVKLRRLQKDMEEIMDTKREHEHERKDKTIEHHSQMVSNTLKRHLLTKGLMFMECVKNQAVYASYDSRNPKNFEEVDGKRKVVVDHHQRLDYIKAWKNRIQLIATVQGIVCADEMVSLWDDNHDQSLQDPWGLDEIILPINFKNFSPATKFLAMVLTYVTRLTYSIVMQDRLHCVYDGKPITQALDTVKVASNAEDGPKAAHYIIYVECSASPSMPNEFKAKAQGCAHDSEKDKFIFPGYYTEIKVRTFETKSFFGLVKQTHWMGCRQKKSNPAVLEVIKGKSEEELKEALKKDGTTLKNWKDVPRNNMGQPIFPGETAGVTPMPKPIEPIPGKKS